MTISGMTSRLAAARQRFLRSHEQAERDRAEVRRLVAEELARGVSVSRIASEIDMSHPSVSRLARESGITVNRGGKVEPLDEPDNFEHAS